jgi:hypothetical protein
VKKNTLLLLCVISGVTLSAQPFIKFAATNKGFETSIGALSKDGGIESTLSYKFSMIQADKPSILSIAVGKQILISGYDENNYSITPTIGYGYLHWKDFSKYDAAECPPPNSLPPGTSAGPLPIVDDAIIEMKAYKPVFGVEVGKDSYMGRVGLTANWCNEFYFGINLRIFPYRNHR